MGKILKLFIVIMSGLYLSACSSENSGQRPSNSDVADMVITGGEVYTVEDNMPVAEAIAIKGDKIIAVGSAEVIAEYIGDNTKMIDATGKMVIPGLIEGHGHYMNHGKTQKELVVRDQRTWDEIVIAVEEAVKNAKPGEWIIGRGWHQDKWESAPVPHVEGTPVHHTLSAISPDNPVILAHTSGHGIFVNQVAMDMAGIKNGTENPDGGEIVFDAAGEPTGMLRENAENLVYELYWSHLAERTPQEIEAANREYVKLAAEDALRHGITSYQDLGTPFPVMDLLKTMADEGNLPIRLYMAVEDHSSILEQNLAKYRMVGYGNNFLTLRTIGEKVFDGALGTHGAWLLEPYTDLPRTSGLNSVPVDEMKRTAELAMEHDYQMAIQGIGDKATRVLMDIYEEQFALHPEKKDLRWRIEHAQVVHPQEIQRMVTHNVIPAVQGVFACSDGPWVGTRLGEERTKARGYVFRTMLEAGLVPTNGTDPPVENIDPIASYYCSVSRILPDGSRFNVDETLTREQALYSYTMGNAIAAFEDEIKGSIKEGKLADITILSQNLITIPEDQIMNTEVEMTIVGGEVKYEKGQ